jgi:hypothetical protein
MLFAKHLAKVFTPNDTETDPEVKEELLHILGNISEIKKITTKKYKQKYTAKSTHSCRHRPNYPKNDKGTTAKSRTANYFHH